MINKTRRDIPENHPIRALFQTLTARGFDQLHFHDEDTILYVSNLLIEFVDIQNMYRAKDESGRQIQSTFEILREASEAMSHEERRDYYKHLGDLTLFFLGLYPESLTSGRRTVSPDYYAQQGRLSYRIVATMDGSRRTIVFRKLSDQFEQCVIGLNWVRLYINDPFYQYAFREFGVT